MIKTYSLLFLFSAFAGINYAKAQTSFEENCAKNLQPQAIRVIITDYNAKINTSYSIKELTSVRDVGYKVPGVDYEKSHSLGLTVSESLFDIQYGASKYSEGQRECFRPKFEIYLKLKPQTMYIASDLKENSCLFRETYEHEYKHSQFNQKALEMLKDELTPWLSQYIPDKVHYQSSSQWINAVRQDVANKILPHIKSRYQEISNTLNSSLDTAAEYSRLSNVCKNKS